MRVPGAEHTVAFFFVEFQDIPTGDVPVRVVFLYGNAVGVAFDAFGEQVYALVFSVEYQFHKLASRRVGHKACREGIGQGVADQAFIVEIRNERPVAFFRHAEQRRFQVVPGGVA